MDRDRSEAGGHGCQRARAEGVELSLLGLALSGFSSMMRIFGR